MPDLPPPSARRGPPLPPTYLLLALLGAFALDWLVPLRRIEAPLWRLAGLLCIAAGLVITVVADQQFRRAATTVHPFRTPSQLVRHGVFRISRNPMYLGMVSVVWGFALALGSIAPLAVPPLLTIVLSRRFIQMEERALRDCFGDEYEAYCRDVRRWV